LYKLLISSSNSPIFTVADPFVNNMVPNATVEPGYYVNVQVRTEDTSYINTNGSYIYDIIVPEEGMSGIELYQRKWETIHEVTVDDNMIIPGEINTVRFKLVNDDLSYGSIWGVELLIPPSITATNVTTFNRYGDNSLVFYRDFSCATDQHLVWEGYHYTFFGGNKGNLSLLNDSVYADVDLVYNDNSSTQNVEIFYKVTYTYACVSNPFSFGTILLTNGSATVNIGEFDDEISSLYNYPNPAIDNTTIEFSLDKTTTGKIILYNITGQQVAVVQEGVFTKGINTIDFQTDGLENGIYFYRFQSEKTNTTAKLIISR